MAWNRKVELFVSESLTSSQAVELSQYDVKFKVDRTILFEPSTAEIVVYNLGKTSRSVIDTPGRGIILKAGYEDTGVDVIFAGAITKVVHTHPGPDWVTTISASSSRAVGDAVQAQTVSLSYVRGTSVEVILNELAGVLGLVVVGGANARGVKVTGNWVYSNNVRGALRYVKQVLAAQQKGLFVDNNELVVYNMGTASDFTQAYLDYDSGLVSVEKVLSAEEQADAINKKTAPAKKTTAKAAAKAAAKKDFKLKHLRSRVKFKSILLPHVRPNSLVVLKSNEVSGTYLVEKATYTGDNMGKDWSIEAEASA